MAFIVGFTSQKGGVGKSAIARSLAVDLANKKYKVKVADMDLDQATFLNWYRRRLSQGIKPEITSVEPHSSLEAAIKSSEGYDFLILDTAGRALADSVSIAKISHIVLQPSNVGLDDLEPGVLRFHELVKRKVPREKLFMIFPEKGTDTNLSDAIEYVNAAGYNYIETALANKDSFRTALSQGFALQEVRFKQLSKLAGKMMDEILDSLEKLTTK